MDVKRDAPAIALVEGVIRAPLEIVWSVQTNLEAWPSWNPDVSRMDLRGPIAPGTEFRWKVGGSSILSRLEEIEPLRRIAWTGRTMGIDAVHVWTFAEEDGRVRVRTEESFDGWIVRIFRKPMCRMLENSLRKGLDALRAEAERLSGS